MRVAVLISNGFEEIEVITPIDILRRAGIEVVIVGLDGLSITGAHSVTLNCDTEISKFKGDLDCIVLPGGMPGALNISKSTKALELINKVYNNGNLVAAICASPAVVLGETGILESKSFTCYPGFESKVNSGIYLEEDVVLDNNLLTSRGPGTAMAFSLAIVTYLLGKDSAESISKALLFPKTF